LIRQPAKEIAATLPHYHVEGMLDECIPYVLSRWLVRNKAPVARMGQTDADGGQRLIERKQEIGRDAF
jgi:hypothetical protein